jgi:hypothetical protein
MPITLIVETGEKLADANSYVSLAEADTYHTNYGNLDWPGADSAEDKKQALILATQSVDSLYGPRYLSFVYPESPQALLFPRAYFYDNNGRIVPENTIPVCLKNAVCELALLHMNGVDIFPVPASTKFIKSESVKAGSVEIAHEYFKAQETATYESFDKVEVFLYPILKTNTGSSWRLVP